MAEKVGKKERYKDLVEPRLDEIKKWIENGSTNNEIMDSLGIGKSAFYSYVKKYPEFANIIKNRKKPVEEIKNALYRRAVGFKYTETKVVKARVKYPELLKSTLIGLGIDLGEFENPIEIKTETYTKQALPDPASCMILLKHWDKKGGWTNDPQSLEIKKQELEIKKEQNSW